MIESLEDKNKSIALVGASNDPNKYGNKILLNLKSKGFNVIPVNTKEAEIDGSPAFKSVSNIKECPSIINFVVPPNVGIVITKDLVEKGYDNFWYQPGAESDEISNYLKENDRNFIDDQCIMVVAK